MTFLAILLVAYILGAVPWGVIIGRIYGIDIRKIGSGNIGATNITRVLGLPTGILVGLLDGFKGSLAISIAVLSFNSHWSIGAVIAATVLGHMYSIFLKGKGGKGVGTAFGAFLIIVGWKVMLAALFAWMAIVILTQYVSLASLVVAIIFPFYFVFLKPDPIYFLISLGIIALIFWAHRENIKRLRANKELKIDIRVGYKKPITTAKADKLKLSKIVAVKMNKIEKGRPLKNTLDKAKKIKNLTKLQK